MGWRGFSDMLATACAKCLCLTEGLRHGQCASLQLVGGHAVMQLEPDGDGGLSQQQYLGATSRFA